MFVHLVCFPWPNILCSDLLPTLPMKSNSLTELMGELKLLFYGRYVRNGFKVPVMCNSGKLWTVSRNFFRYTWSVERRRGIRGLFVSSE